MVAFSVRSVLIAPARFRGKAKALKKPLHVRAHKQRDLRENLMVGPVPPFLDQESPNRPA